MIISQPIQQGYEGLQTVSMQSVSQMMSSTLGSCAPTQILSFNNAMDSVDGLCILDACGDQYDLSSLLWSYSVDLTCWSCYMTYDELTSVVSELGTDYYVKAKVNGQVSEVKVNKETTYDYSTQLDSSFSFSYCDSSTSSNIYNPYANLDGAVQLYQNLSNSVSCIVGIPIYYFKLAPSAKSKDMTFKEYALMDVESVKQIKLIIPDGQMPSSKPEINDFGLEWQSDWTTEISKQAFATAFGQTAQPMEGDLIYIPMMKRMWMVNEAYEEKKDAFMWIATTFKVALVKYQEKGSVSLGDAEGLVNTFVKNKYDDLFGDDEDTQGSGEEFNTSPVSAKNNLYPVYQSDAQRKYVSCNSIDIIDASTYWKGTVISDKCYSFNMMAGDNSIVYQKKFCGDDATISFIMKPMNGSHKGPLLTIGRLRIDITQDKAGTMLKVNKSSKLKLKITNDDTWFVFLRWSRKMKIVELSAAKYVWPEDIPLYKLHSGNYWYDIDNRLVATDKWTIEYSTTQKTDIVVNGFLGTITNIKLFAEYNDNISEILQMYPTNSTLVVNDTARDIVGMDGYNLR